MEVTSKVKETSPITYTREQAVSASIKYFNGDTLAADVWVNKYALKDSYGNIYELTPDDMHIRLAKEISRIENNYANPMSYELRGQLTSNIVQSLKVYSYLKGIVRHG